MLFTQWSEVKATHIYGGRFEYNVFSSTANTVSYTITYRLYTVFAQQLATTQYLTVDVYLQNTTNNTETLQDNFTINRLTPVNRNANTCFSSTEYIYTNTGTPLVLNMGSRYSIRLSTDLGNYGDRIQPGNIENTLFNYEVNCCPIPLTNMNPDIIASPNGNATNGTPFAGYPAQSSLILIPSQNNLNSVRFVPNQGNFSNPIFGHHFNGLLNQINTLNIPYIPILNSSNNIDNDYSYEVIMTTPMVLNPINWFTPSNINPPASLNDFIPQNLRFLFNQTPNNNTNNIHSGTIPIVTSNGFNFSTNNTVSGSTINERFAQITFNPSETGNFLMGVWFITKYGNGNNKVEVSRQLLSFVVTVIPAIQITSSQPCSDGLVICGLNDNTFYSYSLTSANPLSTINGNTLRVAVSQTNTGVVNANNAINVNLPTAGTFAQMYEIGDELILDLGEPVVSSRIGNLWIKSTLLNINNTFTTSTSSNNINFSVPVSQSINITNFTSVPIPLNTNDRYVRIIKTNNEDLNVSGFTFSGINDGCFTINNNNLVTTTYQLALSVLDSDHFDPIGCQSFSVPYVSHGVRIGNISHNCSNTNTTIFNTSQLNNLSANTANAIILGNLTIRGNVTWNNVNVTILPGVKIEVEQGASFTINNSYLHGCDKLWDGIYAGNGATLNIRNSRVEDANLAVFARTSNQLIITNSNFNKNFEHLRINNLPNTHQIENNIFRCKSLLPFDCSFFYVLPNGITRPNTSIGNKTISYRAISIENAFNPLNSNQEIILTNNQINDAFYGVYATKSNVRIQGLNGVSRIKDMHGFGVYFEGGKMNENMNNLTISGTLIRDIFYNSKIKWTSGMGVYLNNSTNAYILSNNFRNIDILGVNGIGNPQKGNYSLNNNTFDKFGFVGIIFSSNPQSNFNIQQNEFNNQSFSSQDPYGAIRIHEDKQVFGQGSCNILQNTIKNVSYGIVCDFRQSITIKDNLIQKLPSDINSGLRLPGVLLSNVFSGTVDIFNNTVELPNGNYSSSWLDVGFEFDNTSPKAVSNIVRDFGRAFWFSGDNDFGQVSCNEFYDCEFGFTFTYSNGIDKFQGSQTSPQDNQIFYQNPTSIIHQNQDFLLDNSFFTYNPTTFYKRNGNGFTPNGSFDLIAPLNPNIILFPNSDPNETGKCGVSGGVGTGGNGNGGGKGGKIAFLRSQPNINPFGAARKWNMELSLLQSLKTDSTLSDPDLILYRDSLDQSNIGNVSRLIQGNSNTNALNLSLDPENMIQTILNLNLNDSTALDSMQYSTLMDIATQSFYKGGPAISMVRTALLKHDPKLWFDYSVQTSANKTQQTIDSKVINTYNNIQLYPNPSSGVFHLENMKHELKTITVYNLQGIKIDTFTCEETTFVSPKLPNGFYLIQIQSLHKTHQFKLVIYE